MMSCGPTNWFSPAALLNTWKLASARNNMNSFEIIRTVRLTEKGTRQGEDFNQYTVVADPRANKTRIRQAVHEVFKRKAPKDKTLDVHDHQRAQRNKQASQCCN